MCILKPYGEIVRKPFDIYHTQTNLLRLSAIIRDLDEEVRVVMEATGVICKYLFLVYFLLCML